MDWPERTIEGQKNWIGKSSGARIFFPVKNSSQKIEIFTTRPDTLFGVTFMALSPEHSLIEEISAKECLKEVRAWREKTLRMSDVERKEAENKNRCFLSVPMLFILLRKRRYPYGTADYVLMSYGTGAIMAVPAHDERDFDFAKKFKLPVKKIMEENESSSALNSEGTEVVDEENLFVKAGYTKEGADNKNSFLKMKNQNKTQLVFYRRWPAGLFGFFKRTQQRPRAIEKVINELEKKQVRQKGKFNTS